MDRIDIAYIHDPDDHWEQAIGEAYPALERLRAEGVLRAIGVGMNQTEISPVPREGDFDVLLVSNRYTLLDQGALAELFPSATRGGSRSSWAACSTAASSRIRDRGAGSGTCPLVGRQLARALEMRTICERHGVPLQAAALQFSLAHPVVNAMLAGVRNRAQLDDYPGLMRRVIPSALWAELKTEAHAARGRHHARRDRPGRHAAQPRMPRISA